MVIRFSHLILLLLAVHATSNQYQGGAPVGNYPDPSRANQQGGQPQQYSYPYPPTTNAQYDAGNPQQQQQQQAPPLGGRMAFDGPSQQPLVPQQPPGSFGNNAANYYRAPANFYNPPQQQQPQGFFAKIKNSLSSAGSSIANALDFSSDADSSSQYAAGPPGNYPPAHPDRRFLPPPGPNSGPAGSASTPMGYRGPPPPPGVAQTMPPRANFPGYGNSPPSDMPPGMANQQAVNPSNEQSNEGGLFGKFRNLLNGEDRQSQQQQLPPQQQGNTYRPYPPPPPVSALQQQQQQHRAGGAAVPGAFSPQSFAQNPQAFPQQQPPASAGFGSGFPPSELQNREQSMLPGAVDQHSFPPAFGQQPPQQPQQQQQQHQVQPLAPPQHHQQAAFQQQQPSHQQQQLQPPAPTAVDPMEWLNSIPSEPQVLIHEDSVVFIMKPKLFHRKKFEMAQAGPAALQVFTDFERVFTRFKTSDGNRALTTEELLESSGIVAREGISEMQRAVDELERDLVAATASDNLRGDDGMLDEAGSSSLGEDGAVGASGSSDAAVYEAYEDGARQYHQALVNRGNVLMAQMFPTVRAKFPQLGLREQWKDSMQMLLQKAVPLYIFSSGFGDIVSHVLTCAGISSSSDTAGAAATAPAAAANALPGNVRIISNFFRTAPDGIVRAMSQPTVHDRNKNVSTAAAVMGMPVPQRPFALVLAAHEDDVMRMTDGLSGVQETMSIGFMEVTEDLPQRLPIYLNSFDAVIIGDGSFKFVSSVLEDVLQTPIPSKAAANQQSSSGVSGFAGKLPNIGFGLRRGLGMLLNSDANQQPASPQQQPGAPVYQPPSPPQQQYASYQQQPPQQPQHMASHYQPQQQQQGGYPNSHPYPASQSHHPAQLPRSLEDYGN